MMTLEKAEGKAREIASKTPCIAAIYKCDECLALQTARAYSFRIQTSAEKVLFAMRQGWSIDQKLPFAVEKRFGDGPERITLQNNKLTP